jgi:hypothetical protein
MNASASVLNSFLSNFDRALPAHVRSQPKQLRAARHLSLLAALTAASVPLLTLMYHLLGYDAAATMVMTAGIVMMIAPFAMGAGCSLAVARDLFIGALYILKVWMAIHLGGIAAPTVPWFLLCPLIALLVGGAVPGMLWGAIVLLTVASLFFIEQTGTPFIAHAVSNQSLLVLVSVVGLMLFSTIIAMCFLSNTEALDQRLEK